MNMLNVFKSTLFKILFGFCLSYYGVHTLQRVYLKFFGFSYLNNSWFKVIVIDIIIEIVYTSVLMIFTAFITKTLIKRRTKLIQSIITHLIISAATVFIISSIWHFHQDLLGNPFAKFKLKSIITGTFRYLNIHFLIYFSTVFIVYTYYYKKRTTEVELHKSKLKEQLSAVQVNVLKYQLHPHFFFNTLNSISSLIEVNPKLAQDTLADFSDLLRDIVFLKDSNLMPISVEIDILKRYIDIMSIRFSDHFKAKINIESNLGNILIPSLIIQPIVENSIKYGYSEDFTSLSLYVNLKKEHSRLVIEIINNGQPLPEHLTYGTGIKNTMDRLKTLYNEDYVFSMQNTDTNFVKTTIVIPIIYS